MTALELKKEIHKVIDELPESTLLQLAKHLKLIQTLAAEKERVDQFAEKVLKET